MTERSKYETEGGFLSRWSRRKRGAEEEATEPRDAPADEPDAIAALDVQPDDGGDPPPDDAPDEEAEANRIAAEAIDIDALKAGDDFTLFMRRGVPQAIRQRALRKLWTTNPVLANLDGLNDYDDDYGNPKLNVYSSIWKAGRGFLTELEQATQHSTGRLRAPEPDDDPELADAEDADSIDADDEADTETEPQASREQPVELVAEPSEPVPYGEEPEDDAPPKRVSLRRRLET